jgi:hypothetical protein
MKGGGAPCERHPGNAKADRIIHGITEEIERVGLFSASERGANEQAES